MTESAIPFPISIALVGAPGAGKTPLAEKFAEISADWFAEQESEFVVLKNPGTILEEEYDTAMGVFGSYAEDLRAYYLNYENEQAVARAGKSYISVSTALENLAHAGVNLEHVMTGLQTQDTQRRLAQGQVAMSLLTFLFMERFRFSFGFYVPTNGSALVLPGADSDDNFNSRVDMALRQIFANFGMRIQVLDQPTVEEKAQEMFDTVKRIVENGPEVPEVETESGEFALVDDAGDGDPALVETPSTDEG